jgi:hypothetical protein
MKVLGDIKLETIYVSFKNLINLVRMIKKFSILFSACVLILVQSCSDKGQSTDTYSSSFSNKKEKIAFLQKYFHLKTKVRDAEYYIMIQDNSGGFVPGPSFWHKQIALKLDRYNLDQWIDTSLEVEAYPLPDWSHILPPNKYWSIKGKKRFFEFGFVWIEENNILLFSESVN